MPRHNAEQGTEQAEPEEQHDKGHFPNDFVKGKRRQYLIPAAIYLFIALVVFWPVTVNLTGTITGGELGGQVGTGDAYQNLWIIWYVNYAIFDLHTSPYATGLLFYPVGSNLATTSMSPIAALFTFPFQAANLPFAFNVLFFFDFALTGLSAFFLADYLIKNKYAAFIAGLIFAFSPFHMIHALAGQTNWISIEFFPLFILSFLLLMKRKDAYAIVMTSVLFVLLVFFGDPEQGIISIVFLSLFLVASLASSSARKEILNRKFALCCIYCALLAFAIGSPFFIPILEGFAHGALVEASGQSTLANSMIWSDPVLSFILPPPSNNLFAHFSDSYFDIYLGDNIERVSYLGWISIILVIAAIASAVKRRAPRSILIWAFLGFVFIWMATGPYLQFGELPQQITVTNAIPGIYLLYRAIPILNIVREPSRFNLALTLCIALLAGFGFCSMESYIKSKLKRETKQLQLYIAFVLAILILIDYTGAPLSFFNASNTFFINPSIPAGYSAIAQSPGNFSVVVLPLLASVTNRPNLYTGESMYYQTLFKKPMVGGYTSRENTTDQYVRLNMPLAIEAASLQQGTGFAYSSPINENTTDLTLFFLSKYNTRFISVIGQAYNLSESLTLDDYMDSTFGQPYYNGDNASIWRINSTLEKAANRSIIAYISQGNWTRGCASLGLVYCNSTLDGLYYGPNVRAINVSVPENQTNISMTFQAASLNSNVTLYIFLQSDRNELGSGALSRKIGEYYLNMTLNPGLHTIFFVTPNLTTAHLNQSFDFGIENITFH